MFNNQSIKFNFQHIQRFVQYCKNSESVERLFSEFQTEQKTLSEIYRDEQDILRRLNESTKTSNVEQINDVDLYKINSMLYQTIQPLDTFNSYLTVIKLSPLLYIIFLIILEIVMNV